VEIDEELKKDLKVRLIREGITLKEWLTRMAASYVDGATKSTSASTRPATTSKAGSGRHDDYLD
jgi:hypothetical protein